MMIKTDIAYILIEELKFKLVGSFALGRAKETSDIDIVTDNPNKYYRVKNLLQRAENIKIHDIELQHTLETEAETNTNMKGVKQGFYINTDDGYKIEVYLVSTIYNNEEQLLLHYEKYGIEAQK